METTTLGKTGLRVSRLGVGIAEFLRLKQEELDRVRQVLNTALDNGINLIDTAECYGKTEELIGLAISHGRHEYILSTKVGHALDYEAGHPDRRDSGEAWTSKTVRASIERSLQRLKTDYIDLLHLHSPTNLSMLEKGEVIEAVLEAKRHGKVRFIGFSGDNEPATWAIKSDKFDTLMTSFNLLDQKGLHLIRLAKQKGMGVIIKRPLANAVWGTSQCMSTYSATREYFRRWKLMEPLGPVPGAPEDPIVLALGFIFAQPEVDTALIGVTEPELVLKDIEILGHRLPIPSGVMEELRRRFESLGHDWPQVI